jgi:1,2-phenylacetyl-CoA epoxidase catalytic subunit
MMTTTIQPGEKIYTQGDPDMPEEFRELLVRMLSHHLENSTNPYYTALLTMLWERGMTLLPEESLKIAYARLMLQEVEHGVINAKILAGLGVDKVEQPIKQYLFDVPLVTFCDLAFFNAVGDRVGVYVGETWDSVPYQPLRRVSDKLQKDELFHAAFGLQNLRRVCSTSSGLDEANEKVKIWWPAALDMFGRSDSGFSEEYVRWGLRRKDNESLRRQYISETQPLLEEVGITVPPAEANRRFL